MAHNPDRPIPGDTIDYMDQTFIAVHNNNQCNDCYFYQDQIPCPLIRCQDNMIFKLKDGPDHSQKRGHKRGQILYEALEVINGERQDQYGNPEDSFGTIADFWSTYIRANKGIDVALTKKDIAMLMAIFKIARESHGHKPDNIRDINGYLGIANDLSEDK